MSGAASEEIGCNCAPPVRPVERNEDWMKFDLVWIPAEVAAATARWMAAFKSLARSDKYAVIEAPSGLSLDHSRQIAGTLEG